MSTKRKITCLAPVESIVGKFARVRDVLKASPHGENPYGIKYIVGTMNSLTKINKFAVREKPRNLTNNPYSALEQTQHLKFKNCVIATRARLEDATKKAQDQEAFSKQTKYRTLYGFVFSLCWAELN